MKYHYYIHPVGAPYPLWWDGRGMTPALPHERVAIDPADIERVVAWCNTHGYAGAEIQHEVPLEYADLDGYDRKRDAALIARVTA